MAARREKRPPYQFSLRGLIFFSVALCVSFGLLRDAVLSYQPTDGFPLAPPPFNLGSSFGAVVLLGGAIGAAIGHFFRDERGGVALMGGWVGIVIAISALALGLVVYGVMRSRFL